MIMRRTNVYGHVPNMPYFKTENACIDQNVTCYFIPHIGDVIIAGAKHVQSFSIPIMETGRAVLSPEYAFIKRAMDIVCSALALVVLSPFMLATAIVIKAYDHGPVLYKQVPALPCRYEIRRLLHRQPL